MRLNREVVDGSDGILNGCVRLEEEVGDGCVRLDEEVVNGCVRLEEEVVAGQQRRTARLRKVRKLAKRDH